MTRVAKRCRLGVLWHPATHKPRILLHAADDRYCYADPDRMTLDLPVCRVHQDRAIELIRESWTEITAFTRRAHAPVPDPTRVGVEWIPLQ